jgi:hypothetical protein
MCFCRVLQRPRTPEHVVEFGVSGGQHGGIMPEWITN